MYFCKVSKRKFEISIHKVYGNFINQKCYILFNLFLKG